MGGDGDTPLGREQIDALEAAYADRYSDGSRWPAILYEHAPTLLAAARRDLEHRQRAAVAGDNADG